MDLRFFHRLGASLLDRKPLCGGIRAEAWVGTFGPVPGHPARAGREREARRRLGQQRHLVEPAPDAGHQSGAQGGGEAGGGRSSAHQGGRAGGSAPGPSSRHRRGAGLCGRGRARAAGRARPRVHRPPCRRLRGLHGRGRAPIRRRWRRGSAACPRRDILRLAEWYQTISPAAISVGNGLERNQNGGSGIRAIFALPALAGKFGVPGGGLVNGAGYAFPKTPQQLQRPDLVPPGTRTLNIVDVGAHLLDPTLGPAHPGRLHLQPQPARRASRPEPAAPRPRPRGPLRGGLRRGDDGQPGLCRRRPARVQPLRARRPLRGLRLNTGCSVRSP